MELPIEKRKFVSVEYPGVVKNEDKMLQSLGGDDNINYVFNTPGQRLELHFRPNDFFSKTACANKHPATSLVLKVKRKKKKSKDDIDQEYEYEGKIIGTVAKSYKFLSLADFQYLPMQRKSSDTSDPKYEPILEQISLMKIEKSDWIKRQMPLFLPPTLFSRIEHPSDYNYRDGPYKSIVSPADSENVISVHRARRPHFTKIVTNEDWNVPTEPMPQAVSKLRKRLQYPKEYEDLKQLFEERPIWSRMSLMMNMRRSQDFLKALLPSVAYYVLTGPWRRVWVRFGYDPKTDPKAKIYQVIDFRIKDRSLSKRLGISVKRSTSKYILPNQMAKTHVNTPKIVKEKLASQKDEEEIEDENKRHKEAFYKFRPGLIPAYHQICYQYCDVEEDKIQKLIHANDGKETICSDKDGWCLPNTTEKIRKIIMHHLWKMYDEHPVEVAGQIGFQGKKGLNPSKLARFGAGRKKTTDETSPEVVASSAENEEDEEESQEEDELNSEEEEIFAAESSDDDEEGREEET